MRINVLVVSRSTEQRVTIVDSGSPRLATEFDALRSTFPDLTVSRVGGTRNATRFSTNVAVGSNGRAPLVATLEPAR